MLPVHRCEGAAFAAQANASGWTIVDRLREHARRAPDRPAFTFVGSGRDVTLSYAELDARSAWLARWLQTEFGEGAAPPVIGLLAGNDPLAVTLIFGALRAGVRLLLLNPEDPAARSSAIADAVGARAALFSGAECDVEQAHPIPELVDHAISGADAALLPDTGAFLLATSGSTATSKIVEQTHANLISNAIALGRHHRLTSADRVLGCLPIHHVNGLHFTLMAVVMAGGHGIVATGFDPLGYPRLIEAHRPRLASVVPSILEALTAVWRGREAPGDFAYFVSAAAPLGAGTAAQAEAEIGRRVIQGYGLTETTNFSTTMPIDLPPELHRRLTSEADIPSVGVALYGNEVAVLRQDGTPADRGEVGEVCMRGHNVMQGYFNAPEETALAFVGDWFHSGDLGYATPVPGRDERFIVLTGRIKNIAKVGGEAVSLEELEREIRHVRGVIDTACVALADRFHGETITALVVTADEATVGEVLPHLADRVRRSALPRRVVRVDRIPRTPTGKIRRRELAVLGSVT